MDGPTRGEVSIARAVTLLVLAVLVSAAVPGPLVAAKKQDPLQFGAEMAGRGNWREARYRWRLAEQKRPEDPRVQNNLAVASEALGEPDAARGHYEKALSLAPGDPRIQENRIQFDRFWRQDGEAADAAWLRAAGSADGKGSRSKGKKLRVSIQLPVPARMDLKGHEKMLVASFLARDGGPVDIGREIVRFLRSEFRKHAGVEVLDVTPAPAVPEQTLEDLLINREFWRYLGREYEADLIVTGIVHYESRDYSGFRNVDRVNPTTGQKVRRSEFVEQEKFEYALDLLFFDGEAGELLYRDRLQREAVFRGTANDPITAFFDLSETIVPDVLAIVRPRMLESTRIIFKK